MSDEYGHVKISRKAYAEDELWLEPRVFSRWEAWEWLIQVAAWKERKKLVKKTGKSIILVRGETPPLSLRYLANAWGWDKNKVSRFLETLGDAGMQRIRDSQKTHDGDTYVIVNYDTYQTTRDSALCSPRDTVGTQSGHSRDKEEAIKQVTTSPPTEERNTHTGAHAREKSTRYTKRCPPEWEPHDQHRQLALSLGVEFLSELETFRDYEFGNAHKDWDATFRVWLRRAGKDRSRFNGNGNGGHTVQTPGEDAGELQRRRQREIEQIEAEYQTRRTAWKREIAERWESEPPAVRDRIRGKAESEFTGLRGDELRFKRAVDARAVQLYAEDIKLPSPEKVAK